MKKVKEKRILLFVVLVVILLVSTTRGCVSRGNKEIETVSTQDYILTYGDSNYIGFTATDVSYVQGSFIKYFVDDGSTVYVQDRVVIWEHVNGYVEYFTDCRITSH